LYYDNIRASQERNDFLKKIAGLENRLKSVVGEKASEVSLRDLKKYFTVRTDEFGKISGYRRRETEIKEKTDQFGFFAIVTSQKMEAGEALDLYRKRDSIEKLFRALKTGLEYDNLKVHSTQSVESKTHLIFIASIIRNKLFQTMKGISGTDKKNFTVPAVLRELEKISVIKDGNGNYRRRYGLTAKQKKILGAVGVTEKDLDKMAEKINS
jgi:transposase